MKILNILLFIILYINQCYSKNYHNHTLFRAIPVTEEHLRFLEKLNTVYEANLWRFPSLTYRPTEFLIPPEKKHKFLKQAALHGIYLTTVIENVQSAFDKQTVKTYIRRSTNSFDWKSYFRLNDIYEWLKDLNNDYSNVMQLQSIGRTYENREILAVKINLGKIKNRPKVIVEGGIHAREWISTAFVTYFMHQILTANFENPVLKSVAESYEWFFVPVLNPDGYEFTHVKDRMHRKNLRGVDINRNFGIEFGTVGVSSSRSSEVYCGPSAFSEAESLAMANFIRKNKNNLKYYLAFHSYGQYLIIPYAYSEKHVENFDTVYEIALNVTRRISKSYGTQYTVGTAYDTVGYRTSGVSSCWVKKTFKVPYVLTFELRDDGHHGFALPPEQILPTCLETMDGILALLSPQKTNERRNKGNVKSHILDSLIILWNVFLFIIVRFE